MENPLNNNALIIANCLSCQGLVRVPSKAAATSKVRCPHCSTSFLLSQILDQAVPELELVGSSDLPVFDSDEVEQAEVRKDEQGRFVVPTQLRSGSKKPRSRHGSSPGSNRDSNSDSQSHRTEATHHESMGSHTVGQTERQLDSKPEPGPNEFTISESESSQASQPQRRSRRPERTGSSRDKRSRRSGKSQSRKSFDSGNTGMEVFKVVIGGVLAIPIAYLLVLWVFKQDPLHIAPRISESVPFAVPEQFRTTIDETDSNESEDLVESRVDPKVGPVNKSGESKVINNLDELPKPSIDPTKIKNR